MTSSSGSILNVEEGCAIAKRAVKDNRVDLEEGWAFIYKAILQLRTRLEGDLNFKVTAEERAVIYSIVYNLCKTRLDKEQLYDRYGDSMKEYISSMVSPALREQTDDEELLLRELVKRWKIYKAMLHWMDIFFEYLDRVFTQRYPSVISVRKVGIMYFRDLVFLEMRMNVKNAVIVLIDEEREGEPRNDTLLKDVVAIFLDLEIEMDLYTDDFEVAMLEQTGAFYSQKAASWILENSYTDYMSRVNESLIREKEIVARYLHRSSEQKVLDKVKHVLFSHYMTHFLEDENSGCLALLREHRYTDILMMGRLFDSVPNGWDSIANIFRQHLFSEVTPPVQQAEDIVKQTAGKKDKRLLLQEVAAFVRKVIELRDQYTKSVVEDTFFSGVLKQVFGVFCNKEFGGSTSAEWLATLCDTVLEEDSSHEKLSGDDIIENVVEFLEYIWDKTLFAEFYQGKLTRRILFRKSVNVGHEQSILSKLKQKYGHQLMSKVAGMLTDWTRSQERQSNFENYLDKNRNLHLGIEFTVTVLTPRFWPTYECPQINLPPEMVKCVEVFKEYYSIEAQQLKLKWIYSLGSCNIIGKFQRRSIKMIATTCQTAILLLFNASERLSYFDIKRKLNLEEEEIDGLLYSLACDKYKILLKVPDTTTVTASDDFKINFNFTDKKGKIKLPMPLLSDKKKSSSEEDIHKDRRFVIDASIVRIMKAKKALQYKILASECAQELEGLFKVDFMQIKRRIEDLIKREFLERDKKEVDLLRYIP